MYLNHSSISRIISLFLIGHFLSTGSMAQRFGASPPSVKWKQINTDTVRVIFPEGLKREAERVADLAHYLNRTTGPTIGDTRKKISIVLRDQTTLSNAYVALGPWRSEMYLNPFQNSLDLGSLPWVDNLVIHEYRHVQQYMNFRHGLSKLAYWIAGEEGQSLANAASVPDWFFEGDAVFQETMVSGQGRGRLPYFFNGYRSIWEANEDLTYMQLRNGSYRRYMPDHYQLGYLLVSYGREKYGPDFWKKVTSDAARFKPLFYPFQNAIKKYSGQSFQQFKTEAFELFKKEPYPESRSIPGRKITNPAKNDVVDYRYPAAIGGDSLLVLKRSRKQLNAWYWITSSGEKKIRVKDIALDDYFTYRNGKIVYSAYETDPRWTWRDYNNIRVLNVHTGEQKKLTRKGKYFSPNLSNDGKSIVAVEVDPGGSSRLVSLNAITGEKEITYSNPDKYFYTYPLFTPNDQSIISAIRDDRGQMSLAEINRETGGIRLLLPFSWIVIGRPSLANDTIFFTASFLGRDQVLQWANGNLAQLEGNYTGSYDAMAIPGTDSMIYSRFTSKGYMLEKSGREHGRAISNAEWVQSILPNQVEQTLVQSGGNQLDQVPAGNYPVEPYHKLFHPFNFHSWRPYYDQPEWSLTLYGDNVLNTFSSELSYVYNENEQSHKVGYTGIYGGLYPWITGGVSYTFDRSYRDTVSLVNWDELNWNLGFRLPFNFSSGRTFKYLSLAGSYNFEQRYFKGASKDRFANQQFPYLEGSLSWSLYSQQAQQHILPRFGHTLFLRYRYLNQDYQARQFLGTANIYLPGIALTHNLVLQAAYQTRDNRGEYYFDNSFPFARGYPSVDLPYMWRAGINYHFPLFYPDWGFGQVVYFLRIRANAFFDYTGVKQESSASFIGLRSTGVEIYFDTQWWNQQAVSFGIRYSRLLDADKYNQPPSPNQWTLILPVNLLR